jgi:hypothetical protein
MDTLKLARRLQLRHPGSLQAEAFAEAMAEGTSPDLATKADLAALKADVQALKAELKGDLQALESRIDTKLAVMESRLLRWMGAGFVAAIAILAALMQFAHR